jgi:hypothetical protein
MVNLSRQNSEEGPRGAWNRRKPANSRNVCDPLVDKPGGLLYSGAPGCIPILVRRGGLSAVDDEGSRERQAYLR